MKCCLLTLLIACLALPAQAESYEEIYQELRPGVPVTGSPDQPADRNGGNGTPTVMARYEFTADTGQAATALISGAGVTYQYLVLSGSGGFLAESDSRLLPTPVRVASGRVPAAGRYYCTVYSSSISVRDTFTLSLQVGDSEILLFKVSDFAFGDRTYPNGAYYEQYVIEAKEGDRLQIDMMSGAIDCCLMVGSIVFDLRPPDQGVWYNDNAEPGTTNSRIIMTAPHSQAFYIHAMHAPLPQRRSTPGGYILSVERAPAAPAEPAPQRERAGEEDDPEALAPGGID